MKHLIIFILINFGITVTIIRARPLKPLREWITKKSLRAGLFVSCYQCVGLWTSALAFYLAYEEINTDLIGYVFIGTGTSHILGLIKV